MDMPVETAAGVRRPEATAAWLYFVLYMGLSFVSPGSEAESLTNPSAWCSPLTSTARFAISNAPTAHALAI